MQLPHQECSWLLEYTGGALYQLLGCGCQCTCRRRAAALAGALWQLCAAAEQFCWCKQQAYYGQQSVQQRLICCCQTGNAVGCWGAQEALGTSCQDVHANAPAGAEQ